MLATRAAAALELERRALLAVRLLAVGGQGLAVLATWAVLARVALVPGGVVRRAALAGAAPRGAALPARVAVAHAVRAGALAVRFWAAVARLYVEAVRLWAWAAHLSAWLRQVFAAVPRWRAGPCLAWAAVLEQRPASQHSTSRKQH